MEEFQYIFTYQKTGVSVRLERIQVVRHDGTYILKTLLHMVFHSILANIHN